MPVSKPGRGAGAWAGGVRADAGRCYIPTVQIYTKTQCVSCVAGTVHLPSDGVSLEPATTTSVQLNIRNPLGGGSIHAKTAN